MKIKSMDPYIEKVASISADCIGDSCGLCKRKCNIIAKTPKEQLADLLCDGTIHVETAFSCTQCGLCDSVCPKSVPVSRIYLEQRRAIHQNRPIARKINGLGSVRLNQRLGFSSLTTASLIPSDGAKRVFMPGCSLSAYDPRLVLAVFDYLRKSDPATGLLLSCCGSPTHLIGAEEQHDRYYASFLKDLQAFGSPELILACPSCQKIISEKSPEIKITSLWELLDEIGLPENASQTVSGNGLILHDPCPTRGFSTIHVAVRSLLSKLEMDPAEFPDCRENTRCCGLGGMVGATNPDIARGNICNRLDQASGNHILTYCASCVDGFCSAGGKSMHLLELLFPSDSDHDKMDAPVIKGTAARWMNRIRLKTKLKKYASRRMK